MKVDEDADVEVNEVEGLKEKLKVEGCKDARGNVTVQGADERDARAPRDDGTSDGRQGRQVRRRNGSRTERETCAPREARRARAIFD